MMKSMRRFGKSSRMRAFSLMEMLIVLAIMALLIGLMVKNYDAIFGGGQRQVAQMFVKDTVATPLMAYRVNMGEYPTTEEGLKALVECPTGKQGWMGPYMKELPKDPWKRDYHYAYPGVHNPSGYDVWSTGPSGIDNGEDLIGNWAKGNGEKKAE
jgi:general secretion pathway protein G